MFEIYRSKKNGEWYWRLKARNGKVIAQSEGYRRKIGAVRGIASVMENARYCEIRCLS